MALPTKKSVPKINMEEYTILLYGSPKIGKTTFCSQFDEPLFILTEAGTNALSVYEAKVNTWLEFKLLLKEIADAVNAGKFVQKTIVIDTFDNLCTLCTDFVMKEAGVTHPSELGFGKGYDLCKREMSKALNFLALLPTGLILTSHERIEEVKTRTSVYNKALPSANSTYRKLVLGMSDLILYAHTVQVVDKETRIPREVRVLETKASENWESGDRTGLLPASIEFNFNSFKEAWDAGLNKKNDKGAKK